MEYTELVSKQKWFVIHAPELYDINPNLIGFRDPNEWRIIKIDNIIFYYRTSPYQKIMGIYTVTRSEEGIDKNFRIKNEKGMLEYLRHQHELKLLDSFQCHFSAENRKCLSFYHLLKNPNRWDNQHVFRMSMADVDLIKK